MRSARTGMCLREQDHWSGEGRIPRPRSTAMVTHAWQSRAAATTTVPHLDAGSPANWRSTPLQISEKLLQRHRFRPAAGINLLAAAWPVFYRRTRTPGYLKPEDWWFGPALLQMLFALEHRAISEALRHHHARIDNSTLRRLADETCLALIGKIHMQWREAMTPKRFRQPVLRRLWRQLICGRAQTAFDPLPLLQVIAPMLPDRFETRSAITGAATGPASGNSLRGMRETVDHEFMERTGVSNLWYSLGMGASGAFTLNNCPITHRRLPDPGYSRFVDLVAARIAHQRACCAGDFNRVRSLLGLGEFHGWHQFDARSTDLLRRHYANPRQVDCWVGMLAESREPDANLGETALAFLLAFDRPGVNAPRDELARLWVRRNNLQSLLLRHYPVLRDGLYRVDNPFARWREISLIVPLPEPAKGEKQGRRQP